MFHSLPAEDVIAKRKKKFLLRFVNSDNLLCNVFRNIANEDLAALADTHYTLCYVSDLCVDSDYLFSA